MNACIEAAVRRLLAGICFLGAALPFAAEDGSHTTLAGFVR
jgi:hypothetical protein